MVDRALDLYERIPCEMNDFAYSIVFNACATSANERAICMGKKLFNQMPTKYVDNVIVMNAAIDMLMKFGDVPEAERLYHSLNNKTIVTIGAMLKGMDNDDS